MKAQNVLRILMLMICYSLLTAGHSLAEKKLTDGEDALDLANHTITYHYADKKGRKFSRCFKTDKVDKLDRSDLAVSYTALTDLKKLYPGPEFDVKADNFIYVLTIFYGLNQNQNGVVYYFEPVVYVKKPGSTDVNRRRSYDKKVSRGYYIYDNSTGAFIPASTFVADTQRYKDHIRICRNGTGIFHRPFRKHSKWTKNGNAGCIQFAFQEIEAEHDDNGKPNTLYFFSYSRSDHATSGLNKQKHYVAITPARTGNVKLRALAPHGGVMRLGVFDGHGADLGSLCPVNCNSLNYTIGL